MELSEIKKDIEQKFERLFAYLKSKFRVDVIILFGSRARNEALLIVITMF